MAGILSQPLATECLGLPGGRWMCQYRPDRMNILIGLLSIVATVGLTGDQTPIEAVEAGARGPVVLLIGGLDGDAASAAAVRRALKRAGRRLHVYAIPLANPKRAQLKFPPEGVA